MKLDLTQHTAQLMVTAIKFLELGCLEKTSGKLDVSTENMAALGVTLEDMYNTQQIRIKMEKTLAKHESEETPT